MKIAVSLALALSAATLAPPASAQFAKAEDAIKYRQSALTVLGTHFGRLGAMANGRAPYDAAIAAADAVVVAIAARPEIWKEQATFKDRGEKMQAEVAKLVPAAKSGNLNQLKAAFGPAAQSCKACHDDFRKK